MKTWGFLRETTELAIKAGIDKDTKLNRTGLDEYLKVIFPKVKDWIHDKSIGEINGEKYRIRPDYRSEKLKMIIEFDGLQHYTKPDVIEKDIRNTKLYESAGYKVVRIPYFIQLSKKAVKTLFNIELDDELFDEKISSLGIKGQNTPAFLCPAGVERMANEFRRFPEQYIVNLEFMKNQNNEYLTGTKYLEREYMRKKV
jgi:hypothetical protein